LRAAKLTHGFAIGIDNLIPAAIWTIIELDVTIITVCLIVSRPWLLKIYPSKMISVLQKKITTSRKSSSNNKNHSSSQVNGLKWWQLFSTFKRLDTAPPAVTAASLGEPFEFDVEKGMGLETGRERVARD